MEIHHLRYFCAVARAGSFTRAAEQEGVAQPTLSQQIRKLEESVGAPLFDRGGRTVRLTRAGQALLPQAQAILRQLADARSVVASTRDEPRGRLSVGCIPTVMPYLLAPNVERFLRKFPDVDLQLVEQVTPQLLDRLQAGELDLAIMAVPPGRPDLVSAELLREPIVAIVPPGHRLAGREAIDPADLRGEQMLALREGHCFRDDVLAVCRRGRVGTEGLFETDQFASIFALVHAGFGVSLAPEMAARDARGCERVPLARETTRRIGYVYQRRALMPPAQRAFIAWLKELTAPRRR